MCAGLEGTRHQAASIATWGVRTTRARRARSPASPRAPRRSAVVAELELDAEVPAAQERDRLLEVVARRTGHAHLVALDGRLDLLQLRVLDRRGDLPRGVGVERR